MKTTVIYRENLTMAPMNRIFEQTNRANRVLARVRHKQLEMAMQGRVEDSAKFARRACRVRRQFRDESSRCCFAA